MNNKTNYIITLFCLMFLCHQPAIAKIIPTYSINSKTIKGLEDIIDQDTAIFIELDQTLTIPKSKMFKGIDNPYRFFITNLFSLTNKMPEYNDIISKWYQQREVQLVEKEWQDFITLAQEKGAKVYAISSAPFPIKDIEVKRYSELQYLEINLTTKVNNQEVIEITRQEHWGSLFYMGILFTGPFNSAQTIVDFMKVTNVFPKKIFTFASIYSDIERMEDLFSYYPIEDYNIHYMAAEEIKNQSNHETIALQQRTLIETGVWLEDDKAEEVLNNNVKKQE